MSFDCISPRQGEELPQRTDVMALEIAHFEQLSRDRTNTSAERHSVTFDEPQHLRDIDARLKDKRPPFERYWKNCEKGASIVYERKTPERDISTREFVSLRELARCAKIFTVHPRNDLRKIYRTSGQLKDGHVKDPRGYVRHLRTCLVRGKSRGHAFERRRALMIAADRDDIF